jgi:protoheme IX farnesyltransferase
MMELIKPRLVFLVLWSVTLGFLIGSRAGVDFLLLLKTLAGAGLVAAGSMTLNQYLEREEDSRMKRTEGRPLPTGQVKPGTALLLGILEAIAGIIVLAAGVNFLTAFLSFLVLASYLFVYTPLKKKTPLCTLAGAVPGALPPMIGWSAARGGALGLEAWVLFLILFVWQLPHFFAIAWICREDYERAGFQMLSVVDPTGERVGRQILIYTLALHLLSFLPAIFGMTGHFYYLGALLLGIWFIYSSFKTAFQLDRHSKAFFRNSIVYLSMLFFLMMLDRSPV